MSDHRRDGDPDTILVQFVSVPVPPDSPEFRERQRLADLRPIPDYLKGPKPTDPPPAG
ncbi:MAG: hypothetical protein K2X82_21525 [Gemmataceae bacterium]|nr:hypothetical protein [Gemmataceae bacterium]